MITAVITGDMVNSRRAKDPELWLPVLKQALEKQQGRWEIYRGDSFQTISSPENALLNAIYIKASLKTVKNLDVRIAIGIGEKEYDGSSLSESNGEAFIYSGEKLESLKKDRINLAVRSNSQEFDYEVNLVLQLGLIAMDNWSPVASEMVKLAIENPELSQKELAEKLNRSQSSVSEGLKRANFSEIMGLNSFYQKKIKSLLLI